MVARRAGKALVGLGVWLTLALAATLGSAVFHLNLPRSRRLARELLVSLASEELRGDLEIGRFIDVRLDRILAEDLVLRDVDGVAVIHIDVAELEPSLEHLLEGAIVFRTVDARGALVRLRQETGQAGDDPMPSFIRAFEPAKPSDPGSDYGGPRVVLGELRLRDVEVRGTLLGRDGIHATVDRVDGRLVIDDGDVAIDIWRGHGRLTTPYPFEAELLQVEGAIDTRPAEGIRLYAHARSHRADRPEVQDDVRARLRYFLPANVPENGPRRLELRGQVDPLMSETLEEVGVDFAAPLEGPLWGTFRLEGPENDLALTLDIDTLGGPVDVTATIRGPDVTVDVDARALEIQRVIENAPEVALGGRVRVRIGPAPEQGGAPERLGLTVDFDPFVVDGWQVPAIRGEGAIVDGVVLIDRFEAPTSGGEVSGSGRVDADGTVTLALRARLPELSREPNLARILPDARGEAATNLDLLVEGERVRIDGRIVLVDFEQPPFRADRVVIEGRVTGRGERLELRLSADATGARVADYPLGDGTVYLEGGPSRYAGRARFQTARGRRLTLEATAQRLGGSRWSVRGPSLGVTAGGGADAAYEGSVGELRFDLATNEVVLEELVLVEGTQRIRLQGNLAPGAESNVDLSLQDVRIASIIALFPGVAADADGRLDADVHVSGVLPEHPVFELEGGLREGRLGDVEGLAGAFRLGLDDGRASIDVLLDLGSDGGAVGVSGTGLLDTLAETPEDVVRGGVYDLELTFAELDLAEVGRALDANLPIDRAPTTGTVRLQGSPYAPNVTAEINTPAMALTDGPTLPVATRFDYDTGVLVGTATIGRSSDPLLAAEASLLLDLATLFTDPELALASLDTLPWRLSLEGEPRRLDALPEPWANGIPVGFDAVRFGGTVVLSGGSAPIRGDGEVTVDWDPSARSLLPCTGLLDPRAVIKGVLRDGVTELDLSGFLGGDEVLRARSTSATPLDEWVSGAREPTLPKTDLEAAVEALTVSALPGLCGQATGTVTGELQVADLFGTGPSARAFLATPDFRVTRGDMLRATVQGTASETDGLALAVRMRWPGNERAELDVSIPLVWGGAEQPLPDRAPGATLETEARFMAAPIAPLLLPIQEIAEGRGFLTGELRIHGPIDGFEVDGEVSLSDGAIDVVPLGQQLRDIRGSLDFRGNWVRLRGVTARDGSGEVDLDGSVAFRGVSPRSANVAINTRSFPVRQEGSVLARVTTNAQLVARFLEESAEIDLDLRQLDVALPDQSTSAVQALDAHPDIEIVGLESRRRGGEAPDAPYPFIFDVETVGTGWVRRSDFSAEVRANLDAVVVDETLRLAGTLELLRGLFEVLGKRFEVQRGGLAFSGSDDLNPGVSLVAVHQLPSGSDTVTVIVGGTLLAPTVDFSSTHPTCKADEEVIALLVSGACSVADTFAASGESVAAEQQALNFLAGITAGVLTLGARRQFGDVVPVLVIESGDAAFQSARVRAGFRADSLIPDFLQGIVRGLYIEGQVTAEQGASVTGGGEAASEGPSGAAFSGGFLFELRFPYDLVGRTTFESSSNAWSVDLTWEP